MLRDVNTRPRLLIVSAHSTAKSSFVCRLAWLRGRATFGYEVEATIAWPTQEGETCLQAAFEQIETAAARVDGVVLHRVLFDKPRLARLLALRKPIVFDYDDAIYAVPSSVYSGEAGTAREWLRRCLRLLLRGRADYSSRARDLTRALRSSTAVSAGNDVLAEFARYHCRDVAVVPTAVDVANFPLKVHDEREQVTVGWYGSPDNQWYLGVVREALIRLSERLGARLRLAVISSREYRDDSLEVSWIPWVPERELEDLLEFDIGIMPLSDDAWAQGKSGNKALYYMGLGIPAVVSAIGVNEQIVEDGVNGFHALSDGDWVEKLENLIASADLRRRMGANARATVESRFSRAVAERRFTQVLDRAMGEV